uniref:AIG1-type G domain-containing protein n=1 Tax=Biomphalaria glabrata TaxID=6526 RepID=A0A2C9LU53_BIOGL
MTNKDTHYTLIFIGRTGTGKSSLCNGISGSNKFVESDSGKSETSEPQSAESIHFGVRVTVVDTPGIMDTSVNSDEAKSKSLREMYQAISLCPASGKRAIILVLKYSDRFTDENRKCIYIAEKIFGEDFLGKCCIILFTHGDLFDTNNKKVKITFEEWCRREQGELKTLFRKCKNRILLFRKNDEDLEMNEKQIESLLEMTDTLDESYTNEKFEVAKRKHKRLRLESILPTLLTNYTKRLNSIQGEIEKRLYQDQTMEELLAFKVEANKIDHDLSVEDDGVFYEAGESSLFHEPKSRAEQILDQIQNRLLNKLNLLLTIPLDKMKRETENCKNIQEVDKLEENSNNLFKSFLKYGLVIGEDNISIDFESNVINLQNDDLRRFQNVIEMINKLKETLIEKRKKLILDQRKKEMRSKLKSHGIDLNSISDTDFGVDTPTKIKKEISELHETLKKSESMKSLLEEAEELEQKATEKIQKCKKNKIIMILDVASTVTLGAAGALSGFASASASGIAKGISRAAVAGAVRVGIERIRRT